MGMGASVCGDTGPRISQTAPVSSVRLLACPAEGGRGPRRRIEGTSLSIARTHDRAPRVPPAASPPAQRYHLSTAPSLEAADRQLPPRFSPFPHGTPDPARPPPPRPGAGSEEREAKGRRGSTAAHPAEPRGPPQRSAAGTAPSPPRRENCQGSAAVRRIGPRWPHTPTSAVPGTTTSLSPAPAGTLPCGQWRRPAPGRRAGRCRKEGPGAGTGATGVGPTPPGPWGGQGWTRDRKKPRGAGRAGRGRSPSHVTGEQAATRGLRVT
ncbi:basic salivary proline-rich protein 1-like [Pogoniulus pusillus]|uniref:basic salivary proline-rich protein 1-like n=1 Tax=Pogoniulus pusillus TaxID=488313 RepID=UPI0030B99AAD